MTRFIHTEKTYLSKSRTFSMKERSSGAESATVKACSQNGAKMKTVNEASDWVMSRRAGSAGKRSRKSLSWRTAISAPMYRA